MNMQGWDTIYALDIAVANRALATSMSQLVPSVQQTMSGALGAYNVQATFGTWQIAVGGSGQLMDLQVSIGSGYVAPTGHPAIPLDGYVAAFQLSLRFLTTSQNQQLAFDMRTAGTVGQQPAPGAVVPLGFIGASPDPSIATIALNAIAAGLVGQASKIAFAFAAIDLVPPGTNSWLAPKNLAYSFFTTQSQRSYLSILSTAGNPAGMVTTIDPLLVANGAQAGFAFSLPLYFQYCVIPSVAQGLPNNPVGSFRINGGAQPTISIASGVGLGGVKVGAITYYPSMDSFTATPGSGQITVAASGGCDVYAGLGMSWAIGQAQSNLVFDKGAQTIGLASTGTLGVSHNISIPWYWWALSVLITGIADGIASLIGNDIASFIGGQVGGLMAAAPPTSVHFAGMRQFSATSAVLDGAVILTGTTTD